MRILLTGGNGFVGCNILNEIIDNTHWDVTCLVNENHNNIPEKITKIKDIEEVPPNFDCIIHAGGNPSSKSCINNPESAINDNILLTFKILEYARKNNITKIIFFSSCEVYGYARETSSEIDLLESHNMYGASKVACEHMCSAYYHTYGICTTAIRLLNTYGPFCQEERFPSIIKKKFETEENPHFILTNKTKKRWLDIKKMAEWVILIINNMPNKFETFNFVGDENLSLDEFVGKIAGSRNFTYEYMHSELAGYHPEGNADGTKLKNFLENMININTIKMEKEHDIIELDTPLVNQKNIIIYTHMPGYNNQGGTVVQYYLGKVLEDLGQNVRIYTCDGSHPEHGMNSNFYNNDFPIDDNCVVIYCEGTGGNPLNAKNVVRWMLSELGKNVPHHIADTWGKDELVYYFNSEIKFNLHPEKNGVIYKQLSTLYTNPIIKQHNFEERTGICYAIRKAFWHTIPINYYQFNEPMFEIPWHFEHAEVVEHFNKYKMFICYDPCTFLTIMAAICGCIPVLYPWDNLTKLEWIKTTAASDYVKAKGLDNLYGIAYGLEDLQYAIDTLHLAKEQWKDIEKFNIENTVIPFIRDINNFENMQNSVQNNFF